MRGRRGYTLVELTVVVVLIGILVALAAPRFTGWMDVQRVGAGMRRFVADVHLARVAAVRRGAGVTLELSASAACPDEGDGWRPVDGWRLVADDGTVLKTTDLAADEPGVCLRTNQSATLGFDSRGLLRPFANRTVEARAGNASSSVAISVLGRVRHVD